MGKPRWSLQLSFSGFVHALFSLLKWMSHCVMLDPGWFPNSSPTPPPGPHPPSLTYGHQLHDQLGVGDVGAADLHPTGPQALGGHHTAHVICGDECSVPTSLPQTWAPALGQLTSGALPLLLAT